MSRLPVVSSDGNAWGTILNDFLSVAHNADGSLKNLFANVKSPVYGALGDGKMVADGAITTGTPTLTSASAVFSAADVGKAIRVNGAGTSAAALVTTISAYVNVTTVTLAANAATTVTAAIIFYGTDDTTAIQAAITTMGAGGGGVVYFPYSTYLISSSLIVDYDSVTLLGFGQRTSAPTIMTAADPTYALTVGNTKNANSCLISGLQFEGHNSTTSTGKGILFRSNGGKILQTRVVYFGGNGIDISSFSGTIFEVSLEDVNIYTVGMNATTSGDGLIIQGSASDCEYHRVLVGGDVGKSTMTNGITLNGAGNQKFIDCHTYFCKRDGFYVISGAYCQIIGGEYENNTLNGIESSGVNHLICGVSCFGNGNADIATYAQSVITDCTCASVAGENIYANSANGGVISDNVLKGNFTAIQLDTGASGYTIHDNTCSATTANVITTKSTNSDIHDNTILGGGNIVEQTGAQGNTIHDNMLIGGGTITRIGTTTRLKNNVGYNPVGHITSPTIPASTVAYTNTLGVDCMVFVTGGTVTVIAIGGTTTGATSGWFRVPVGQTITMTYSVVPTSWTWFGD